MIGSDQNRLIGTTRSHQQNSEFEMRLSVLLATMMERKEYGVMDLEIQWKDR